MKREKKKTFGDTKIFICSEVRNPEISIWKYLNVLVFLFSLKTEEEVDEGKYNLSF